MTTALTMPVTPGRASKLKLSPKAFKVFSLQKDYKLNQIAYDVTSLVETLVESCDVIDYPSHRGSYFTMLASEDILAREWNSPEEDRAWENL